MTIFKSGTLAVCLSMATILGACGADETEDRDGILDESTNPLEPKPATDAGASDAATGSDAGTTGGNGGAADAGGSTGSDAGGLRGIDLNIGQDTPDEPATRFEFLINRAQETPACEAGADLALGAGRVIIADSGKWVEVTVGSKFLSGPSTAAHVHFGATGTAGPIVLDFGKLGAGDIFFKRFTEADFPKTRPAAAKEDFPADFPAFVKTLQAGNAYVNVHTAACKGGEIRGQIKQ
jgi:hypothetical protein